MNEHLSWDALNDYTDDALAPAARADAARHLESCEECRASLLRLRGLIATAAAVPRAVAPPATAWSAIRAAIERKKVVALPVGSAPVRRTSRFRLAAAAILLVVASSAVTARILRERSGTAITSRGRENPVPVGRGTAVGRGAVVANFVPVERDFLKTVGELTATLDAARGKLAPETVRAVERSLKVIDDAIVEAREALLRDPASAVLRDMLSNVYQQKVDLLRRASARAQAT